MHSYCPDLYSEIVMRMDGKLSIGQILLLTMVLNGLDSTLESLTVVLNMLSSQNKNGDMPRYF